MPDTDISIRRATPGDQPLIRAMVHAEKLNPSDLKWKNFMVAARKLDVIGAAQLRQHPDGSRELGSLVVDKRARGRGPAKRLIDALLKSEPGPVWTVTVETIADDFRRWGFEKIDPRSAPVGVRRNYRMGSFVRLVSLLLFRPMGRLVILERLPSL